MGNISLWKKNGDVYFHIENKTESDSLFQFVFPQTLPTYCHTGETQAPYEGQTMNPRPYLSKH